MWTDHTVRSAHIVLKTYSIYYKTLIFLPVGIVELVTPVEYFRGQTRHFLDSVPDAWACLTVGLQQVCTFFFENRFGWDSPKV
jgi:hypothetical protein